MAKNAKIQNRRWMSLEAAKLTVKKAGVKSRDGYLRWWDEVRPIAIPKFPYRVYPDWVSWSHFLDSDKTFVANKKREYRSFWEACRYVQSLKLSTKAQYMELHKAGKLPDDLPLGPDRYYKEWRNWEHWLGLKLVDRVEVQRVNVAVMAVCRRVDLPMGYYEMLIEPSGIEALKALVLSRPELRVMVAYKWDASGMDAAMSVLQQSGRKHDDVWLIQNINAVLFEFSNMFDMVRLTAGAGHA